MSPLTSLNYGGIHAATTTKFAYTWPFDQRNIDNAKKCVPKVERQTHEGVSHKVLPNRPS